MATESNPWKTLGTREVYRNAWIRVREDRVIRPDGAEGIYGVVETRIATGAVPLTEDGYTYLVGQYRYPLGVYSWEIPEGGADPGEDPMQACQRELQEETGLVAERWEQLGGEIHLSNCFTAERGFVYLARGLRMTEAEPDGTERLQVRKLPFDEALLMAKCGEITDAITLIALERAARVLAAE